jgi:hypothetical protein
MTASEAPVAFSEGNAADRVFSDVVVDFEAGVGGKSSNLRVFCCASTERNACAPFLLGWDTLEAPTCWHDAFADY